MIFSMIWALSSGPQSTTCTPGIRSISFSDRYFGRLVVTSNEAVTVYGFFEVHEGSAADVVERAHDGGVG